MCPSTITGQDTARGPASVDTASPACVCAPHLLPTSPFSPPHPHPRVCPLYSLALRARNLVNPPRWLLRLAQDEAVSAPSRAVAQQTFEFTQFSHLYKLNL